MSLHRNVSRLAIPVRLLLAIAIVASLVSAARAQGASPDPMSPDEAALRQQYKEFDRLLVEHDLEGVMSLMTRDVTFEGTRGKRRNLLQWKEAFNGQVKSLVSTRTKVEEVAIKGRTAEVKTWCEQRYDGLNVEGTDKRKFIVRSGAIDKWVKTADGWRLKSSQQQAVDIEPLD